METYYNGFCSGLDLYSRIDSPLVTSEDVSHNDSYEMGIMDDMQYEPLPLYGTCESSWNSSSTENLLTVEGFAQRTVNSWPEFQHSVYAQSAFVTYRKADSNPNVGSFKTGQTLHKRCFTLLRKIDDERKLTRHISRPSCSAAAAAVTPKDKKLVEHMIAERGRRIRMKQHFSNLYSLLPRNCKNSRNSILANTTSYLKELKLRVAELEQQCQILQASIPTNISIKDKSSSGFESHKQSFNSESTVIYRSNEVTLEQRKENPCLVNIKTTMQTDLLTCPNSVLMKQLEQLRREQVEVLSINSNTKPSQFRSNILVTPKGQAWNISMWQNFGNMVRQSFLKSSHDGHCR